MSTKFRRESVLEILSNSTEPITGLSLSEKFGVTRQVIVSDIAILRAQGHTIIATPQGYMYERTATTNPERTVQTIAAKHSSDYAEIKDELFTIIDFGGYVMDVTVEHPVYGEITGNLHLRSRHDVEQFIERLKHSKSEPLLILTDGLHLHTIETDSPETMDKILNALAQKNFLAE
ncbi:MAG: transcription repressor NadR [Firmicutes bacterium]|nr:transcription repressor NadR [Bacillota bacterium]